MTIDTSRLTRIRRLCHWYLLVLLIHVADPFQHLLFYSLFLLLLLLLLLPFHQVDQPVAIIKAGASVTVAYNEPLSNGSPVTKYRVRWQLSQEPGVSPSRASRRASSGEAAYDSSELLLNSRRAGTEQGQAKVDNGTLDVTSLGDMALSSQTHVKDVAPAGKNPQTYTIEGLLPFTTYAGRREGRD